MKTSTIQQAPFQRVTFALMLTVVVGCRTCGEGIDRLEPKLRVDTTEVDFGRVLEGTTGVKHVTLVAETRAPVSVKARTAEPFSAESSAELEGGGSLDFEVRFLAAHTEAKGTIVFTSGSREFRVQLKGQGVRPPLCKPTRLCRETNYSFELDKCVETIAADDTLCVSPDQCLEKTRCRSGECVGARKRCVDDDECTQNDACNSDVGCIFPPRTDCPNVPCRQCDKRLGCNGAVSPIGTPCGAVNCTSSKLCTLGACLDVPTPEGFICGPPVACFGPMTCRNKVCVRPDAGPWSPDWPELLKGDPEPSEVPMVGHNGSVYFTTCGPLPLDEDGGIALLPDGGLLDGGSPQTLFDGGRCALHWYIANRGIKANVTPLVDPEQVNAVTQELIVLRADSGVRFRSRTTGELLGELATAATVNATQLAMLSDDGGVVAALRSADGGTDLVIATPASATPLAVLPAPVSHLAVGLDDTVFAFTPGGAVWRITRTDDAGTVIQFTELPDAGTPLLAVADDVVVAGAQTLRWLNDGGVAAQRLEEPPGTTLSSRDVLVTPSTIFQFFRGCSVLPMSCMPEEEAVWVRAFSRANGTVLWESTLADDGAEGRLVEAAPVAIPGMSTSALVAVVERLGPASASSVALTIDGGQALECYFPQQMGHIIAASFAQRHVVTLSRRPDGGVVLEGWPISADPLLPSLPYEMSGWRTAEGTSGQRRPAR